MARVAVTASDSYGVDTNAKLTAASAAALRGAEYQGHPIEFIARYVSLGQPHAGDIDSDEIDAILGAGLALLLVQHVRAGRWTPSGDRGAADGTHAASHALAAGYVVGAHLGLDLESLDVGTPAQAVIDHVEAWAAAANQAGYPTLLYIGFDTVLTPDQLYHDLPSVHRYWSDFGPRSVAQRGFCMKQLTGTTHLPGVPFGIDPDRIMADDEGDRPIWMVDDGT